MKKSVIFFGNEKLATGVSGTKPVIKQAVIDAGFDIEQHVTGPLSELRPHKAQLAILAAYGRIIPQPVLDQFSLGIINVHPSLLPAYRGPTPIEQAILDGASKTGVSIMHLSAGMDEGPIYRQRTVHLNGNETKSELTTKLQQLGADLLVEALPLIYAGLLKPRQQPHPSRATYSHKLNKEDGVVDWSKPAEQIEREIRAFTGWPKSRTQLAGKDVELIQATVVDVRGKPGEIRVQNKQLLVFCYEKALSIEILKPSGKKEMPVQAFLAGYSTLL